MNKLILITATMLLTACGASPNSGSTSAAMSTKPIFSVWYTASGAALDLRGIDFGTRTSVVPIALYGTTYQCLTTITATGDQMAGTVVVESSVAQGLGTGSYTTACADTIGTYKYQRNVDGMAIGRALTAPLQYY